MKKIAVIVLLTLVAFNAHGQLTKDGRLDRYIDSQWDYDLWYAHMPHEVYTMYYGTYRAGAYIPHYLPKTKTVKVNMKSYKFDAFSEEWNNYSSDTLYFTFNPLGNLVQVFSTYFFSTTIEYDSVGRISKITESKDIKIKYTKSGVISKILLKGDLFTDEMRYSWLPNGYSIAYYKNGICVSSGKYTMQKTQNGLRIQYGYKDTKGIYELDSHGIIVKNGVYSFLNSYDKNNNITTQIKYKMADGEKYYEWKATFDYEYEFYE